MGRRPSTAAPMLCLCGCQHFCKPGNRWITGHNAKSTPEKTLAIFWSRVEKTETCWLWTGAKAHWGYGLMNIKGTLVRMHRFSYELHYGPIPPDLYCLHHCDVPACVRPDHLFLGTLQENAQDMARKGRSWAQQHPELLIRGDAHWMRRYPERVLRGEAHSSRTKKELRPRGERHGLAKLTEGNVREIRRLRQEEHWSQQRIAELFGVTQAAIALILKGKTWTHVPDAS